MYFMYLINNNTYNMQYTIMYVIEYIFQFKKYTSSKQFRIILIIELGN